jgi:NADH:ubiquinone oxidoreductase subunit F (NADH-binding)
MTGASDSRRVLPERSIDSLDDYVGVGGGVALERARHLGAEAVIEELQTAGLRGRGGAGFPTAAKWRSIIGGGEGTRYAVCNAAEGEPGTFKDRTLIRANPFQVLEGLLVAAQTVGAVEVFVALKTSFETERERLAGALLEMERAGWLDGIQVTIVGGPEEYLFGEEKALLEVIEGRDPLPRWLPPYLHGLFVTEPQLGWEAHEPETGDSGETISNPTLVNNAETLAQAAWILANGADEFRALGTAESPGTIVCTVVGDVTRPGVHELAMGTTLRELLDRCGGPRPGREIAAVVPGVANEIIIPEWLDTPLTYEDMQAIGSGLGAAGFTVYDDTACMVEVAHTLSRFLSVESCGQCVPCKLGTGQITEALDRIRAGTGTEKDVDQIGERLRIVADGSRCYLPSQERNLISSILRLFPGEFAAHLGGRCTAPGRAIPTPKIVEIVDGAVTFDSHQEHKSPDWTYRD